MDAARSLSTPDLLLPVVPAVLFILLMSLVREPTRQRLNALIAAGFASLYVNGGLGAWEFLYMGLAMIPAYLGLRSYAWIGVAWLMHTGWDTIHHLYGNPLWLFAPKSSAGCAVMDAVVALWFFAGAPTLIPAIGGRRAGAEGA